MAIEAARTQEEKDFLASLTPEQRLQWKMHEDNLAQDKARLAAEERQSEQGRRALLEIERRRAWQRAWLGNEPIKVQVEQAGTPVYRWTQSGGAVSRY